MKLRGGSLSLCLQLAIFSAVAAADQEVKIIRHIEKDLSYDENNKLKKHTVLYTPSCNPSMFQRTTAMPKYFDLFPVMDDALEDVFSYAATAEGNDGGECRATCLERGVDRSVAHAVLPSKVYTKAKNLSFADWIRNECVRVEVCLINYYDSKQPIELFWKNPDTGHKQPHMSIPFGERNTKCFHSYIGHQFAVDQLDGTPITEFTVEYTATMGIGESPAHGQRDPDEVEKQIQNTLKAEWTRHNRIKRTFSPLGFKKGRLPPDVFASMGAFYYNNRGNKVREEWNGKGVFVNWWESDCYFIPIPWDLKKIWQLRLLELVEAWAGVPVEETAMYGLRQYETGARLLTHVDRHVTHAVSLIVNIAQGNLTEPWPVEVHDHADRLHEVIMQPGDVVYYESAKCLHARNRPMVGRNAYYVNLFTHYRPTGDEKWFEKPNHEGTPEPVVDVEGECRLVKKGTTETANGTLGFVESVQCDDKRLGPYVSPSLFTAENGNDLFEWWQKVGPPPKPTTIKEEL